MLVDAISVVIEALQAAGHTDVHPDVTDQSERISSSALSAEEYIWVEEDSGTTPHIFYADRPSVRIIVYSTDNALARARQVQLDLANAQGDKFPSGGLHRLFTLIKPYRQDIAGLPPGVVRVSALYELIVSTIEKWN